MIDKQALASSLEKTLSKPVFQAAIAKALAESLVSTFCDIQQDRADLADHMRQAKPPEAFGPELKVMGHAVVHSTGNPQWDRKRVELLDFCKVSGKYLVRTIYPQAAYGSRQITWIDRQSIDHSSSDAEQLKPVESPKRSLELPHGWRWLEAGEVIRKGDAYWHGGKWWDYDNSIGAKVRDTVWPSIRRNRFKVGEKVVHVDDKEPIVYVVNGTRGDGTVIVSCRDIEYAISPNKLAPYIEDSK